MREDESDNTSLTIPTIDVEVDGTLPQVFYWTPNGNLNVTRRALNHLAAREKTQSARYVYTDAYIVCMLYNMIVSFHLC